MRLLRRKIQAALIFMSMATVSPFISAANWVAIGDTSEADFFIDTSSIRPVGNKIKAWFLYSFKNGPQAISGAYPVKSASSFKELDIFNCVEGTSGAIQQIYTALPMGAGEVTYSRTLPMSSVPLEDVVPDSAGEAMLKRVCSTYRRQ